MGGLVGRKSFGQRSQGTEQSQHGHHQPTRMTALGNANPIDLVNNVASHTHPAHAHAKTLENAALLCSKSTMAMPSYPPYHACFSLDPHGQPKRLSAAVHNPSQNNATDEAEPSRKTELGLCGQPFVRRGKKITQRPFLASQPAKEFSSHP